MALNVGAKIIEKVLGHDDKNRDATTDISNPARDNNKYADPSGEKMKALAWYGKGDVRVIEAPKPALVDDNDIIVKVTGSTVCGSDVHLLHAQILQLEKGDILGHEFIGEVEQVGPGVKDLKVGDRVVNSFCISCGKCRYCKEGLTTMCDNTNASSFHQWMYGDKLAGVFGYSHFVGGYSGGQAEFVRVPNGDLNLLKIPDSIPDERALYLSDVLPTSYHSTERAGIKEGETVAVWGLGPIGFMACMWALKKGAKTVIGIDANWRCDYAKQKLPGLETIDYSQLGNKKVAERIREIVPGGVDVAIEASGSEFGKSFVHKAELALGLETDTADMINECLESVRKFGRVSVIADYVGYANHVNLGNMMERGISLIGCGQCPVQRYWKDILGMLERGEVDPGIMLTHRVSIDDLAKAYTAQEQRKEGWVKCFVETRFSRPKAEGTPALTSL